MPLILGTNSIKDTGFDVANSLRFDDGSSDNLSGTLSSGSGSDVKGTISLWVKRCHLGTDQAIICGKKSNSERVTVSFTSENRFEIQFIDTSNAYNWRSTALFRDTASWYNCIIKFDTGNVTANSRVRAFINNEEITSWNMQETIPNDLKIGFFNGSDGNTRVIGARGGSSTDKFFDGYICEVVGINNSLNDNTDFGEVDEDSGIWKPIDVSGLTFGTNGFYLDFENSGSLGNDKSGNGNNFTVNNLTSIDQTTDTCTNNFATLNALLPLHSSTFSEGNCKWTPSTASQYYWSNSTFGLSQGKWYMEAKLTTSADHNYFGISVDQPDDSTTFLGGGGGAGGTNDEYEWSWKSSDGKIYNNTDGGTAYGNTYTTGDILGLYLDLDNNKLYFAKNGTIQNSGTGISITDPASTPNGVYFIALGDGTSSNSSVWEVNFGNPTFSISSGNSDPSGYGNFEYSPNDGGSASFDSSAKDFYALNTKNLAEYG